MSTKRELERKYEVPEGFTVPDLSGIPGVAVVGDPAEHRLDATYYDTAGLRLARRRVTLRRRTGGNDAGWHIKRPAGGAGDRSETHVPIQPTASAYEVPPAVAEQVRALSRGEPLEPVATVRTRRLERPLCGADGTVLALVADDTVVGEALGDAAPGKSSWRELEVELVDGAPEVLDVVDRAVRAAGAGPAQIPSKLARALGDRFPAESAAPPAGRGGDALRAYLSEQRDEVLANDPGVRDGDADAVHDMRVATRRLRATMRTFRSQLDRARAEPLRTELKRLADKLGAVRDGDVMAGRLAAAVEAEPPELVLGPVAARVQQRLAEQTAKARRTLGEAMNSGWYAKLLDALDDLVQAPLPAKVGQGPLIRRARKALRSADGRLAAAGDTDADGGGGRDERLHSARRGYKRARYAVEAVRPVAGKPARRLAKRLSVLQDVLGAHQDSIVTANLLRDFGLRAHQDGENAFTYGLLHAHQRHAGEKSLADLPRASRRAASRAARGWLG